MELEGQQFWRKDVKEGEVNWWKSKVDRAKLSDKLSGNIQGSCKSKRWKYFFMKCESNISQLKVQSQY